MYGYLAVDRTLGRTAKQKQEDQTEPQAGRLLVAGSNALPVPMPPEAPDGSSQQQALPKIALDGGQCLEAEEQQMGGQRLAEQQLPYLPGSQCAAPSAASLALEEGVQPLTLRDDAGLEQQLHTATEPMAIKQSGPARPTQQQHLQQPVATGEPAHNSF